MTGKQHAVMWLGLSLILVRLFTTDQWSSLWGTLHASSGKAGPSQTPAQQGGIFHDIATGVHAVSPITDFPILPAVSPVVALFSHPGHHAPATPPGSRAHG